MLITWRDAVTHDDIDASSREAPAAGAPRHLCARCTDRREQRTTARGPRRDHPSPLLRHRRSGTRRDRPEPSALLPGCRLDSWQGEQVHYVESAPERIWGGLGPDGPAIARPERALLDCLADRRFGVSLPQSAEAIDRAMRIGMPVSRLVRAARRYETAAVSRRLGFLVELLAGAGAAAPFLKLRGKATSTWRYRHSSRRRVRATRRGGFTSTSSPSFCWRIG